MFVVALGSMPIGYYTVSRFVVTVGSAALVTSTAWIIAFGLIAITLIHLSLRTFTIETLQSEGADEVFMKTFGSFPIISPYSNADKKVSFKKSIGISLMPASNYLLCGKRFQSVIFIE